MPETLPLLHYQPPGAAISPVLASRLGGEGQLTLQLLVQEGAALLCLLLES